MVHWWCCAASSDDEDNESPSAPCSFFRHQGDKPVSVTESRTTSGARATAVNKSLTAAQPAAFRPGRLSPIEILERVFPYHRRAVLELVLQGCSGDIVKAIEHFLSAHDTIAIQQQQQQPPPPPPAHTSSKRRLDDNNDVEYKTKSAFTALSQQPYSLLHPAFASRPSLYDSLYPSTTSRLHPPPLPYPPALPMCPSAATTFLFPHLFAGHMPSSLLDMQRPTNGSDLQVTGTSSPPAKRRLMSEDSDSH